MRNVKRLVFSSLFLIIALISFSSFNHFQNHKSYQEEIKPISDSITYVILLGDLKTGTYDTSRLFEQKEVRVNGILEGKTIENYLRVLKYSALLVPKDKNLKARGLSVSSNKTESIFKLLKKSDSGDKLFIFNVVGKSAKGDEKELERFLILTIR